MISKQYNNSFYKSQGNNNQKSNNSHRSVAHAPIKREELSALDHVTLSHMWNIPARQQKYIQSSTLHICPLKKLIPLLIEEDYRKGTYQDSIFANGSIWKVNYLFCSGDYLADLEYDKPILMMALKFRKTEKNNFCLIRPFEKDWSVEELKLQGARDLV